jgi:hypothetical protein
MHGAEGLGLVALSIVDRRECAPVDENKREVRRLNRQPKRLFGLGLGRRGGGDLGKFLDQALVKGADLAVVVGIGPMGHREQMGPRSALTRLELSGQAGSLRYDRQTGYAGNTQTADSGRAHRGEKTNKKWPGTSWLAANRDWMGRMWLMGLMGQMQGRCSEKLGSHGT